MKRAVERKKSAKIALALTWDGARWPVASLPPKARVFLAAHGFSNVSGKEAARLLAANEISELRICWVPRLKSGKNVLADIFATPNDRRVAFRATKTTRFGEVLGVVYRRSTGVRPPLR